ncbi:MAG: HU family DNA-binding protein [Candidatus Fermentibacteraceae bacterium]|nr:HU family DNA-binding protein [Candidatus Fermentibacteraceae bacterium]
MTKDELAGEVAERTGVSRKVARTVLAALLDTITEQLCSGENIYFRGFGCFETREGKKRRARDPQGEGLIDIPPRIRPVFRPYKDLKEVVQENLGRRVAVDFLCLSAKNAGKVSVVGKFNGWNEDRNPMQRLPDGSWVGEIQAVSGQTLRYQYWIDGALERDPAFPSDKHGVTMRQI